MTRGILIELLTLVRNIIVRPRLSGGVRKVVRFEEYKKIMRNSLRWTLLYLMGSKKDENINTDANLGKK